MPTILDVARAAGVGVGTVSRVLNDHPRVAPATRARVRVAIDQLGYRPSSLARALSLGKSTSVTVLVPGLTSASVGMRLRGIIPTFNESDRDVQLSNVDTEDQRTRAFEAVVTSSRPAGLLVISIEPTAAEMERIRAAEIPLVLVDAAVAGTHSFVIDNRAGARAATQHLLDLGHSRIAFVGDVVSGVGVASALPRKAGFKAAMQTAGVAVPSDYIQEGPFGRESALQLTHRVLDLPQPPTAIVAATDTMALGVLEAAHSRGLAVPGDLSVIGFDDIDVAPYVGLSTVRQPLEESGAAAARCLMGLLAAEGSEPAHTFLPVEVVVRATTGPTRV